MNQIYNISIPSHVEYIINTLTENGFEGYAVGGCIRDSILGKAPKDWDITTSALPAQIKGLFSRTIDTGIKHGTVTVLLDKEAYEVTTYRIDGVYEDFRHPKNVEFTSDLIEDLKRRDFTINAMAYNPFQGLVDAFDGVHDLESRTIKCVGNPADRFLEDALRTLRAIRFSAQLNFSIEQNTKNALSEMAHLIKNISRERIQVELDKILLSEYPEKIKLVYETGITKFILPEFDLMMETPQNSVYHIYTVGEHSLTVLKNVRKDHYLRWAALLHDIGKPFTKTTDTLGRDHFINHGEKGVEIAGRILKELRFDNKTVDIVTRLIKYHDYKFKMDEVSVRKAVAKIGEDIFPMLLELSGADLSGKSSYAIEKSIALLEYVKETYHKIIENKDCITLKELEVKGGDLIKLGVSPGRELGDILNNLLEMVLSNPSLNNKETLTQIVKKNLL